MRAVWCGLGLLFLVGCEQRASLSTAAWAADGTLTAPLGEHVDVFNYRVSSGFETQGSRCDTDEDSLVSSDPAVLDVHDTGSYGHVKVNGQEVEARWYQITGLRLGDARVHATCSGEELTATVHVVP